MYGVVLWNDLRKRKALIWCEDHANLAYFQGQNGDEARYSDFESGDLVSFDLTVKNGLRLAVNVTLVASDEYPTLAQGLREAGDASATGGMATPSAHSERVVCLARECPPVRWDLSTPQQAKRKQA